MYNRLKLTFFVLITLSIATVNAQDNSSAREKEKLQMIALEALIHMPEEQALPKVLTLLEGDGSDDLKESALFVLSQMDDPDASAALVDFARNGSGEAQEEAITYIGISGDETAMAALPEIYASGDEDVREAVLEAFMIADDVEGVFTIAMNATDENDYEEAVEMLAVMEAHDELAQLREAKGTSEALVEAFMISDNYEELEKLARDGSNPDVQEEAIQALGIVDHPNAATVLVDIYKSTDDEDIREAALEGLFIGDYDQALLDLYRSSSNAREKGEILEALVIMDSDFAMEVIDAALAGDQ
ncbi:MAG: HEAT repeat domain-containing protein [Woeseiaceae bacterium]